MLTKDQIKKVEKLIHYTFSNKQLLQNALTHKTYAYEAETPVEFNERLEFLGDSVLNFIVAEQLYTSNRYFNEGELTRRRAQCVNNKFLAEKAEHLGLGTYLLLGKGEQKQQGEQNKTNLANCLEAVLGAIFLDSDLETLRSVLLKTLFADIDSF